MPWSLHGRHALETRDAQAARHKDAVEGPKGEMKMNRRSILVLAAIGVALSASNAFPQQVADIEGVKAASKAFYTAVGVIDDGTVMEKVWARTTYVTYIGPRSTSIIVGWD